MTERETARDDRYSVNAAKTQLREAYNRADVEGILSSFADQFTDLSDGQPSFFNVDAKTRLRARLERLFDEYLVEFVPIVIDVHVAGGIAIECGWHEMTLRPKNGGLSEFRRTRYVEGWRRGADLAWRIVLFIDNADHKPKLVENLSAG
jgi:ketosteroid isomerase-like protein